MRTSPLSPALLLTLLAVFAPVSGSAQTIQGRVLDEVHERPVPGVVVALVTRDGQERGRALSDPMGRFTLTPPEAGEYLLVTERFGYRETRSPLLALSVEGQATMELLIAPAPLGLEGLEVEVEERATVELDQLGLTPGRLGNRWIGPERIDAIPVKRDIGVILERTAQAGTRIMRPDNVTLGDNLGLCVSFNRVVTADGGGTCALIVLDGVVTNGVSALDIDPESVESIAILEPSEATTFYGTQAGGGAVLVWTRRGR